MIRLLCVGITLFICACLLCGCNEVLEVNGKFYTLDEAYNNGWLITEDLKNISFYYNGEKNDDFLPKPNTPETLNESTEIDIKKVYLNNLKKYFPKATLKDIWIRKYYGIYGDCVIVNVSDDCIDYDLLFIPEHFIGTVLFKNYCERELYVYKET